MEKLLVVALVFFAFRFALALIPGEDHGLTGCGWLAFVGLAAGALLVHGCARRPVPEPPQDACHVLARDIELVYRWQGQGEIRIGCPGDVIRAN